MGIVGCLPRQDGKILRRDLKGLTTLVSLLDL